MKTAARELGIPVSESVADAVGSGAEVGVVVAFGQLVRPAVLAELAMVNVHFSLLPRWRGAAPVERAILAGDPTTGVSIMALEAGLDTGPVYGAASTEIGRDETAAALTERLGAMGTQLLVELLSDGAASLPVPVPQEGAATYAQKVTPEDVRLDWSLGAEPCHRRVRVGRAWTTFRGERLVVRDARVVGGSGEPGVLEGAVVATANGGLELVEVQASGRSAQSVEEWARGARPLPGERLG